jgi:diaminopimelate decarboxylase
MILKDNRYHAGGVDLLEIADEFDTPLYVYDAAIMRDRYQQLKKAFDKVDTRINYACKALTNLHVLKLFRELGAGLDTVSIQEVWLGLKAGFKPEDIIYTPNCVSLEEIKLAVETGVKINIDNISILEQFGHLYGNSVPVCIRLNPHIMAGGNAKISTGHIDSKFGISIYQMRHLERVIASEKILVEGLHMHTGSDILDVGVFLQGADILLEAAHHFKDLKYIDFGSGFKVPYKNDDIATDIEQLGERMSERFLNFCEAYGRPLTIMFEPGKFLVSEAGYFLASVNVVKQTTATVFAGIDTGLNHFIRPMFYEAYHEIVNISNPMGSPRIYTVVGYICETDTFGWDRKINEITAGDVLCFKNAGAYGFVMSSNYNARFRPAEVLVDGGKAKLIRRRETMDDLLSTIV